MVDDGLTGRIASIELQRRLVASLGDLGRCCLL